MLRSQISLEFVMFVGIGFMVAIILMLVISQQQADRESERDDLELRDLAYMIEEEVLLASSVEPGYWRNFSVELPNDGEFDVSVNGSYVKLTAESTLFEFSVPPFQGQIVRGANVICNKNGEVFIGDALCR